MMPSSRHALLQLVPRGEDEKRTPPRNDCSTHQVEFAIDSFTHQVYNDVAVEVMGATSTVCAKVFGHLHCSLSATSVDP